MYVHVHVCVCEQMCVLNYENLTLHYHVTKYNLLQNLLKPISQPLQDLCIGFVCVYVCVYMYNGQLHVCMSLQHPAGFGPRYL